MTALPLVYFSASSLNLSEPLPFGVSGDTTWLNLMTIGDCARAGPDSASARAVPSKSAMRFIGILPDKFCGSLAEFLCIAIRIKTQSVKRQYRAAVEPGDCQCYASPGTMRHYRHEQ